MSLRAPLLIVLIVSTLAGCTDLTPIQNDIKDLRSQVSRLSAEQASVKATLDSTAQSAKDAVRTASSKSEQALALAQTNQKSIEATNEKIDRMFRRHLSK